MPEITQHTPNTFCWPELLTSDADSARRFYQALLGWDFVENPVGEGQVYVMAQLREKNVGAMYQQNAEQRKQGIPSHWLQYVSVANVAETVAKAKARGARVVVEPMDVFDAGRMAVLADPQGATFALWQPIKHIGVQLAGEPGTSCWNEFYTRDRDGSGAFYTNVFGWASEQANIGGTDYTTFTVQGRPAASMLEIKPEWGELPPMWMVYFTVASCDAAVKTVQSSGGQVFAPSTDLPGIGRFAVVADPQGASFGILAPAGAV
ncbi:MAG: VOC family protein [Candidatus Krumholzibacteria bacterium]|nr:VOC family protein [Candidatus Krumholzibacteria bacterium]